MDFQKHIKDEKTGITYTLVGDYYIPDIKVSPEEKGNIGIWGHRRLDYLKQHKTATYGLLLAESTLWNHLAEINKDAEEMFSRLVSEMAQKEGVTEEIKAEDQISWVCAMNNIRQRATEIVNAELIFT